MADKEKDPTKFNVSNLFTIPHADKEVKKNLVIGAYNGAIQLSIRDKEYTPGNKMRSVTITPHMAFQLSEMMEDIIKAPQPGKKLTLIFNGLWNKAERKRDLSLLITIGMDDAAICYIGVKHVDFSRDTYSGRFNLVGDRNLEVSGQYDDEKSRSFQTLKLLHHLFATEYFQIGSLMTRNHMTTGSFGGKDKSSSKDSTQGSESFDDEF